MIKNYSRFILVSNISTETTEEELKQIFSERVGPVRSFHLVFDKSGRSKGMGYCEFHDPETANSAIRNLTHLEIKKRVLKLEHVTNDNIHEIEDSRSLNPFLEQNDPNDKKIPQLNPNIPPKISNPLNGQNIPFFPNNIPPNFQKPDQISQGPDNGIEAIVSTISSMTIEEICSIMIEMKQLIQQNLEQANKLLVRYPQLAHGLFHAQLILGTINPNILPTLNKPQFSEINQPLNIPNPLMHFPLNPTNPVLPPYFNPMIQNPNQNPNQNLIQNPIQNPNQNLIQNLNQNPIQNPIQNLNQNSIQNSIQNLNQNPINENDPQNAEFQWLISKLKSLTSEEFEKLNDEQKSKIQTLIQLYQQRK
ncbi:cleavage stimulation factor 3' pre-RNA subunit 2 [Anaeramoeba ignava]|uniref:Cleavage stimulation factor 3' pre-RNA subunit 2 n=1 Tax=Anaeramoeba ignava TaxID=1746090 RepID=A0A9Q0RA20_ANAIG|nr:cleavage stimulation factor 3' pre-RNA subunit 2 [Anaeramoeba ignava]